MSGPTVRSVCRQLNAMEPARPVHDPRRAPLWRVANNWGRWFLWRSGTSTSPDPFHRGDDNQIAYYQTAEIAQDVADRLNAHAAPGSHEGTVAP